MKTTLAILVAFSTAAHAGPRTSANYTVLTDTAGVGGTRATSASYTNDGSAGSIVGISTVAAPAESSKAGYLAQINETTGITIVTGLGTVIPTVNETAQLQLAAIPVLDDGTSVLSIISGTAWSVLNGPLTIDASGLATAGAVYQDSAATARGIALGFMADYPVTVLNTLSDNFGSYAADGLADDWQVQYFGLDNPLAAPTADPDGDGEDNLFEFTSGLVPTSNSSHFAFRADPVAGSTIKTNIVFSPIIAGRTYTVEFRTSLITGNWAPLTTFTQSDAGAERTVTDTAAGGAQKFYRVKVQKP